LSVQSKIWWHYCQSILENFIKLIVWIDWWPPAFIPSISHLLWLAHKINKVTQQNRTVDNKGTKLVPSVTFSLGSHRGGNNLEIVI
jgi:hypothetical protein